MYLQPLKLLRRDPAHLMDGGVAGFGVLLDPCGSRGEDEVEQVAATRLDGFADDEKAPDLGVDSRLFEKLSAGRVDQRLPSLHATAGQQPVAVARLAMGDEEETLPDGEADGDPDARLHGSIIVMPLTTNTCS
jgi:hypothetical protein